MEKTKRKLNTSRYFLNQLTKYENNGYDFQHNLDAFITFGRAVLELFHKDLTELIRNYRDESDHIKSHRLDNFLQAKKYDINENSVVKFFISKRRFILHQGSINLTRVINMVEPLAQKESITVARYDEDGELIDTTTSNDANSNNSDKPSESQSNWVLDDWEGSEDIISLCENFQKKLESLVEEAIKYLKTI